MRLQRILCTFLLLFAGTLCTSAQTVTGTLNGTVTDTTGAVVPNVEVLAKSNETGAIRTTKTSAEGYYSMPFLPLGSYDVMINEQVEQAISERGKGDLDKLFRSGDTWDVA